MEEKNKVFTVAIAGNPNTGKTSLYNILAHENQHTGNWPGVTVEKKEGVLFKDANKTVKIVDLPGIYSLRSSSDDEIVASNFLIRENPDLTIVVVDASRLERSLYLYTQIKELGQKTIIALNMEDVAKANGIEIDTEKMSELLNCPVIETIGNTGKNLDILKQKIIELLEQEQKIVSTHFREEIESKIEKIEKQLPKNNEKTLKGLSIKLIEGDKYFVNKYGSAVVIENDNLDTQTKIIEDRWHFIKSICSQIIKKTKFETKAEIITDKLDKVFTHKFFGLPIFFAVIFLMFLAVYSIGNPIVELLENFMEFVSNSVGNWLDSIGTTTLLKSFIVDGLIGGVGAVVVFFPNIFILFLFLGILEDSGYLSRGAFVMDKLMNAIGLHGKSFIPLIMGFGCSIPAILGTRIMERKRDKFLTMLVAPFISCSARLPVFVLFASVFFKGKAPLVIFSLYIIGIIFAIIIAKILSLTLFKGETSMLVMELPAYHIPSARNILKSSWENSYSFLLRATTFIMATVFMVWLLASFPVGVEYASESSYIGILGKKLSFIFSLSGYGFWQATVALITGLLAKEAVIGTLGALFTTAPTLEESIVGFFTPLTAYSYMLMILLYTPCLSAVSTFKQESGSWKWTIFFMLYTFFTGLLVSILFYQVVSRI